jgi:hypothetical protein
LIDVIQWIYRVRVGVSRNLSCKVRLPIIILQSALRVFADI